MFAQRIIELRKERNLTQLDLAKALAVSQRTVSYWEKGSRECDFNTLIKIAKYFNVSTDYLLGLTEY